MKILITGGTTFVSRYTAEFFVKRGDEVYVLNRGSREQVEGVCPIIADRGDLGGALRGMRFDAVLDIVAYTADDIRHLLDAGIAFDDYVFVSSSAVYPETNPQPFSEKMPCGLAMYYYNDVDSTRSYHVDQSASLMGAFPAYQAVFASNFHSGFLAYPFHDMHGSVQSGLLTLSSVQITSAMRRSYPIDESFPRRFFDLDRCFSVARIPTSDGHELVLVNTHMSAYDEGGVYRAQQLDLMLGFLSAERAAGNYVIAGGDWNHALAGSRELYPSAAAAPDWVATFDDDLVPEGFSVVRAENLEDVATCRGSDMPYEQGVSYEVTVDGFIVSDNVSATAVNIDAGFAYSYHNPLLLTFELIG